MKYTILTAFMLTACTADPQGLRTPQRDIVADIIAQDEYNKQQTTVQIVDRDVALNLLNGDYK
jgi:starvation-inducible outer membrane lipoprotein